jgi:hypothetical protein
MQKLVAEILAAWRRAERLEQSLPPGSPAHAAAQRACERLRDAYGELVSSGAVAPVSEDEARDLVSDVAEDLVLATDEADDVEAAGMSERSPGRMFFST